MSYSTPQLLPTPTVIQLPLNDADVSLRSHWLDAEVATAWFERLYEELTWQTDRVRVFGKHHPIPRKHQWYGERPYTWSGLTLPARPAPAGLDALRREVETTVGTALPAVLANLYRDGNDCMGAHADDEPELGPRPVIASVSLGAERDFVLRHRTTRQRVVVSLPHGSLLVMRGTTQEHWLHELPRRRRVKDPRINLTFRSWTAVTG